MQRLEIRPAVAGVVYSPGREGWQFFPEPLLYVGFTGDRASPTVVRTVLSFPLPELEGDALLIRACLCLHLVHNEPRDAVKLVCLRETPAGALTPWSLAQEYAQPVPSEHRLLAEIDIDLDFDLMGPVTARRRGAPNNGLLLDFGAEVLGLVGFGDPLLRLEYVVPARDAAVISVDVEADAAAVSRELLCRAALVRNIGPGLAWITPLYRFGREAPRDPAGMPLGVLDPGGYLLVEPRLPAQAMAIRVETALAPALIVIAPLSGGSEEEDEGRE